VTVRTVNVDCMTPFYPLTEVYESVPPRAAKLEARATLSSSVRTRPGPGERPAALTFRKRRGQWQRISRAGPESESAASDSGDQLTRSTGNHHDDCDKIIIKFTIY
jgi:hypothetical protein